MMLTLNYKKQANNIMKQDSISIPIAHHRKKMLLTIQNKEALTQQLGVSATIITAALRKI